MLAEEDYVANDRITVTLKLPAKENDIVRILSFRTLKLLIL
jgi:hypothetical protein